MKRHTGESRYPGRFNGIRQRLKTGPRLESTPYFDTGPGVTIGISGTHWQGCTQMRARRSMTRGSIQMNFRQKIAVVVVDILVLVELCISIYFANLNADNFTPVFLKVFMGMLIPTLIAAKLVIRRVRSGEPEAQQT
jgi:hypothetical protein